MIYQQGVKLMSVTRKIRYGFLIPALLLVMVVAQSAPAASAASSDVELLRKISNAYADISSRTVSGVVTIKAKKKIEQQIPNSIFDQFDFFSNPRKSPQAPRKQVREVAVLGSGFIVDSRKGYIITNAHVVGDVNELVVKLYDGREVDGEIIGEDSSSDLAVVKIEAEKLTALRLGDSDAMRQGEIVMAFGSPFSENLDHTATQGIISAKGRFGVNSSYGNLIQTSAAINQGNSGGPLVNLDGEVIGINQAIIGPNGGFSGIGLAIPSNRARFVYDSIIEHGKVIRGYMGVYMTEVTPDVVDIYELGDYKNGVIIGSVEEGSPADESGLKAQDVIVDMNGKPLTTMADFRDSVAQIAPGKKVKLKIIRDGKSIVKNVRLGVHPGQDEDTGKAALMEKEENSLGITVSNLDKDTAEQLDLDDTKGILIKKVNAGSPAGRSGIKASSVIQEVNRVGVSNVKELREELAKAMKKRNVVFLLIRDAEGTSLIPVKLK
jgi:serine protease Do